MDKNRPAAEASHLLSSVDHGEGSEDVDVTGTGVPDGAVQPGWSGLEPSVINCFLLRIEWPLELYTKNALTSQSPCLIDEFG